MKTIKEFLSESKAILSHFKNKINKEVKSGNYKVQLRDYSDGSGYGIVGFLNNDVVADGYHDDDGGYFLKVNGLTEEYFLNEKKLLDYLVKNKVTKIIR